MCHFSAAFFKTSGIFELFDCLHGVYISGAAKHKILLELSVL